MTTLPAKPKFISSETLLKKRVVECKRCGAERTLPDGRVQLTETCAACMMEMEYLLKKRAGTLKEGEERPIRAIPRKIEKVASGWQIGGNKPKPEPVVTETPKDFITPYPNQ